MPRTCLDNPSDADVAVVAWISVVLALLPLLTALRNVRAFVTPSDEPPAGTGVSILIPARDEAATIERAVHRALASRGVDVEVLVADDESTDDTAAIVSALAERDARVTLVRAGPLPTGWAGKQRACWLLAGRARHDVLMFVDADVALSPDAAARAAGRLLAVPTLGMVSGFPRETTVGLAEQLVIPWIHVLLLGYLPMDRMRRSTAPGYGAACGQWIVARLDAYVAVRGHAAAPASRHDGTSLPRTFRAAGWSTDLFDGSRLAECRMYDGFDAVWSGFAKSPGEGMATVRTLPVWTVLIGLGHIAPAVFLITGIATGRTSMIVAGAIGSAANVTLRLLLCVRYRQSWIGAALHPFGAMLLLVNQWTSLISDRLGRRATWRGRRYTGPRAT